MPLSLATVGSSITATFINLIIAQVNLNSVTRIIPTISSTGGTVAVSSTTGEITGSGAITQIKVTIPSVSNYKQIRGRIQYIGGGSGSHTIKLASAGTAEATASSYRGQVVSALGGTVAGVALTPGTSWAPAGSRLERVRNFTIDNLADTQKTTWSEWGSDSDASSNESTFQGVFRHTVSTALDGFIYDFSSMGTFVELSIILEGVQ